MTRAEVERHCVMPEIQNTVEPSALTSRLARIHTHTHTNSNTEHASTWVFFSAKTFKNTDHIPNSFSFSKYYAYRLTICETTVADNELLYDINHVGIASEIDAQLSSVDQTLEALRDKSRFVGEEDERAFYQNRKRTRGNETIKLRNKINESLAHQMAFFTETTTKFPCLNGWSNNSSQHLPPEHIFSPTRPKEL
jgi:hypothetical protein